MFIPAQTTPTRQVFSPRDVHILKQPPLSNDALEGAMACLSENEQRRAADFVFDDDRRRFVTGRYILRHFLAEILKVTPAEVALLTSRWANHGFATITRFFLIFRTLVTGCSSPLAISTKLGWMCKSAILRRVFVA